MAKTSNFALSFNMFCDMIDQIIDFNKIFVNKTISDGQYYQIIEAMTVGYLQSMACQSFFDVVKQSGTRSCLTLVQAMCLSETQSSWA